jgi:hypothetical protein
MADGSSKPDSGELAGEKLAKQLRRVVRAQPKPAAWQTLSASVREEHGPRADQVLAGLLSQQLARRSRRRLPYILEGLAALVAPQASLELVQALAARDEPAGRQLALALLGRWPHPLEPGLFSLVQSLLPDRELQIGPKLAALVSLVHTLGPASPELASYLQLLIMGRGRSRSIDSLRRLEVLAGPCKAIETLCAQLEEQLRMTCPRCPAQMRRPAMIKHLWDEHRLVLDRRRARDPWALVDDWIEAYRALNDLELLQRCRTLVQRLDGPRGLLRLYRLLLSRKTAIDYVTANLLEESRRENASVCPWCYAVVPQPSEVPPLGVAVVGGKLGADGYLVRVSNEGWQTELEVRTPAQLIYQGPEPHRLWTQQGATAVVVGPLVLLATLLAIGPLGLRSPLIPVLFLLAVAAAVQLVIFLFWRAPASLPTHVRRLAWTRLVPELHADGFSLADSAFLAGLAALSTEDGLQALCAQLLPPLVERLEEEVAQGKAAPAHLAYLTRLRIADAATDGTDPIPLVVEQIAASLAGRLPLLYAERLLDGWEARWWTRGNVNRLRVLVCDRAFEEGYEVRNLIDAGQTVPSLATVLRTNQPDELAALRLLWSQRAGRPWDRFGGARTAFELAAQRSRAELFGAQPDLLLWQDDPDGPLVSVTAQGEPAPVQIMLCLRGIFCQQALFTMEPRQVEVRTHWRSTELILDHHHFWSKDALDDLERRLERWCRFAFREFLPQVPSVYAWQSPDRTKLFLAWGARACPECQRYFLPRIGRMGVAQDENAPMAQIAK